MSPFLNSFYPDAAASMGSATAATNRTLICRRPFFCTECHRKFKTKEELYIHAEACIMEAFESEVIAAYSDVPGLRQNSVVLAEVPHDSSPMLQSSDAGLGITIKKVASWGRVGVEAASLTSTNTVKGCAAQAWRKIGSVYWDRFCKCLCGVSTLILFVKKRPFKDG
ncbi:zinc finger, C2H2 type [Cooperia oncophora]